MKQLKERIPYYAILPLIAAFSLNMLIYAGCRLVNAGRTHYILKTPLDDHIPFLTVSSWSMSAPLPSGRFPMSSSLLWAKICFTASCSATSSRSL